MLVTTNCGYNTGIMTHDEKIPRELHNHSPIPLYYQLKDLLEEQIASGSFQPGEMIPSENQLCKSYQISRTTVRQALNELVGSGVLVRTQGKGTFVSKSFLEKPAARLSGFNQNMKEIGVKPGSEVLQFAPIVPSFQARTRLHLAENEAAIYIKLLRFANDEVVGIDSSFFPFKRFLKLLDEDFSNQSIYHVFRTKFDTHPTRHTYQIEAIRCPREIANDLEVTPADIVLHVFGIVYDQNDIPFEFSEEFYRADRYAFQAEIRVNEEERFKGFHVGN
jgi:GntR family transcriptional regulator